VLRELMSTESREAKAASEIYLPALRPGEIVGQT